MLYASMTFWLFVIIFSAWGVHQLWSGLVKPRVVNAVLLPGTLVAQLGHVLGLLVTGNPVRNTTLMSDDESGAPTSDTPERQRIPILGPILVGLLPLVACGVCLYVSAKLWGGSVLSGLSGGSAVALPMSLPTSLSGVWELLRTVITLMETMLNAIIHSDLMNWTTVLFLYLAVCLTVRMAPFEGNRRGAMGAIILTGLVVGISATLTGAAEEFVRTSWLILSFAVATLLFLLVVSLVVSGAVALTRILAHNE